MGSYSSFCVFMDSNGTLRVLISPYASLELPMGFIRSLCVLIGPCGSS